MSSLTDAAQSATTNLQHDGGFNFASPNSILQINDTDGNFNFSKISNSKTAFSKKDSSNQSDVDKDSEILSTINNVTLYQLNVSNPNVPLVGTGNMLVSRKKDNSSFRIQIKSIKKNNFSIILCDASFPAGTEILYDVPDDTKNIINLPFPNIELKFISSCFKFSSKNDFREFVDVLATIEMSLTALGTTSSEQRNSKKHSSIPSIVNYMSPTTEMERKIRLQIEIISSKVIYKWWKNLVKKGILTLFSERKKAAIKIRQYYKTYRFQKIKSKWLLATSLLLKQNAAALVIQRSSISKNYVRSSFQLKKNLFLFLFLISSL